jgi:hypothetical protein
MVIRLLRRGVFVLVAVFCVFLVVVSALEVFKTPMTIKGERRTNVTVQIVNANTEAVVQTISTALDGGGSYRKDHYLTVPKVALVITFVQGGIEMTKQYGPYTAGMPIVIQLSDPVGTPATPIVNDTNSTNSTVHVSTVPSLPSSPSVTGNVVSESSDDSSGGFSEMPSWVWYFVTAILLAGCGASAYMYFQRPASGPTPPHAQKAMIKSTKTPELIEAERKIQALEHEVNAYKNRDKIEKIEQSIVKEREEIERLKRG